MGNGYPAAAFGGKRDRMEQFGQDVSPGGTFGGKRVGMAVARATLNILAQTDVLETVARRGEALQAAIRQVLTRTGLPFVISGHPAMFGFWFAEEAPQEYRDWRRSDHTMYEKGKRSGSKHPE